MRKKENEQSSNQSATKEQVQARLAKLQAAEPAVFKSHLDNLNDGIIAIIITIMVLSVPLPTDAGGSYHDYLETIFIFGVSFFVIANFWYELNRITLMLKRVSKRMVIANFLFIAALALIPILTKWMMLQPSRLAVLNFGFVYLFANIMKTIISGLAWRQLFKEIDGSPRMFSVKMGHRLLYMLVINALLLVLAWFFPRWVLLAYLLISLVDFFFPERTAVDQQVKKTIWQLSTSIVNYDQSMSFNLVPWG